jgi:asparagine synthase (glutamine-hydrolysing)
VTFKLDYVNNEGLPHKLSPLEPALLQLASAARFIGHHKYLHYRSWFRQELAAYLKNVLTEVQTRHNLFWNTNLLERMAADHCSGCKNYVQEINAVLTLEAVGRLLFRDLPRGPEPPNGIPFQLSSRVPIPQS